MSTLKLVSKKICPQKVYQLTFEKNDKKQAAAARRMYRAQNSSTTMMTNGNASSSMISRDTNASGSRFANGSRRIRSVLHSIKNRQTSGKRLHNNNSVDKPDEIENLVGATTTTTTTAENNNNTTTDQNNNIVAIDKSQHHNNHTNKQGNTVMVNGTTFTDDLNNLIYIDYDTINAELMTSSAQNNDNGMVNNEIGSPRKFLNGSVRNGTIKERLSSFKRISSLIKRSSQKSNSSTSRPTDMNDILLCRI